MSYYTPIPALTGALHGQPKPEATRSEWYFDRNLEYQEAAFLDAPDIVPSGGERVLQYEGCPSEFRLGIAHVERP